MTDKTIIIGAGHNGLVCAAYLARAGRNVVVLEAAAEVGGAAITREFAPQFRVSACAHLLYLLDPGISRDLDLEAQGLKYAAADLDTISLAVDGDHLTLSRSGLSGAGISADDQASMKKYRRLMGRFEKVIAGLHQRAVPRLASGEFSDLVGLAKLAWSIRRMGRNDMQEFLRLAAINIYDVMEEYFEHPMLKGALALDAVLGTHLGTRSNNSVFTALHRNSGSVGGKSGSVALPKGGMGAVTRALAGAAEKSGAQILTSAAVKRIRMDGDRVAGVELENGEQIDGVQVISNADPKTTFLKLLGAANMEAGFTRKISNFRSRGNAAKLHLALKGLPDFRGLDTSQLGQRLVVAPDMNYIEQAFNHAKYGEYSDNPALEIVLPSMQDDSLAPADHHVLSAVVQYAPYELKQGWESARGIFEDRIIRVLEQYAPGIRSQIIGSELLTPLDIEREFRITGGHWHHGELALDQALMLRPVPGAAQYITPVRGLYLCGAGAHPGGGVMGNAGRNAAKTVLEAN